MKHNKQDKKLEIVIDNLTEAQAIAIEEMLAIWQSLGNIGSSRYVAFFADGDGNFHPQVKINGERPVHKSEEILGYPVSERKMDYSTYWIDFDTIAWKLRELGR